MPATLKTACAALAATAVTFAAMAAALSVPPTAVLAAAPVTVLTSDFEDATEQGWTPRGSESIAVSTAAAHGGMHSLIVADRTAAWQGPARDLLDTVELDTRYTYSVWVRMAAGEATTQLRMSVERRWNGTPSYEQVVGNTNVSSGAWTQLTGTYVLTNDADFFAVYVESANGAESFHIDDFELSYVPPTPIQEDIPSLQDVFAADFPIGAAIGRAQILGEHARLLTKHFNTATPGNALKWDATEPSEGNFTYGDADALVGFARDNGIAVRGHTLVWHNQTPGWVFQDENGQPLTATPEDKALLTGSL